jgi:PAS domain S-box-containing protein
VEEELRSCRGQLEKKVEQRTAELEKANRKLQADITERKKAKEELKIKDSIVASSINAIALADMEGNLTYVSPSFIEMWGYDKAAEILGKRSFSFRQAQERAEEIMHALKSKGGWIGELVARRKDGSYFDVQLSANIVADETGNPVCMSASFIDITKRKQAEEALRESEENLRTYLENAPDGVYLNDLKGNFLYVNKKAEEILGYKREELIGKGFLKLNILPAKYLAKAGKLLALNAIGRPNGPDEFELTRKDGSPRWVEISTAPIKQGGEIVVIGFVRDITERKEAEELYTTLANSSPVGVYTVQDSKFTYVNPAFQEASGYTKDELLGRDPSIIIHPEDREGVRLNAVQMLKGKRLQPYEFRFITKSGETRWALERASSIIYDGKRATLGNFMDITERKRAEEELQKVEKLESISTLAGGIAHDFNNFLTGILGNITLAERYVEKGEKIYDRLVDAERASLRARDLTQQLLTFSGGGAPIKKPASIAALVKESATFALSGSNVKCDFCLPDDLWAAEVDEAQISRVINNIVINADQAMPQGGMISVRAENMVIKRRGYLPLPKGNYLEIAVKDCGTGIPKKYLSRIFEPYFTTKKKGSGLGLATAYSIIKNHGGYMTVESKLGVGTTIYIYVPATTEPVPVVEETADEVYIGGRGRILVMDDEEMIRDLLHNSLSEVGYKIELAADGTEAIEKYAEAEKSGEQFEAVILDLTIPGGMGGKETIKKLLKIDPNVKAIASSGYANDRVMANFKKYGFSGVVTKPYRVAELEKTLRDVIYTSESEKAVQKRREAQENSGTGRSRILVMDDAQEVMIALGENLPDLGYEVEFARNGYEAISMYRKALESGHSFDVVLIDLTISEGLGGEETIHRLIEIEPEIRAIVTSGYPTEPAMIKPERFGFRAAIAKPYRIEELGEVLHRVIEGENLVIGLRRDRETTHIIRAFRKNKGASVPKMAIAR